jgi:hypothetical protein
VSLLVLFALEPVVDVGDANIYYSFSVKVRGLNGP